MSVAVCLWWCLFVCCIAVNGHTLGREGDMCKVVPGASWTCKTVQFGVDAAIAIQEGGKWPEVCGWNKDSDVTVCCEPELGSNTTSMESDICKVSTGASWTCKTVKDSPTAAKAIQESGKWPEICGWTEDLDVTVCCEPQVVREATSVEFSGDICKVVPGASWTCKTVKNCPTAAKAIQEGGKWPEICGLNKDLDVTVCCEPGVEIGAKSKEMCTKYAESVFIRLPDKSSEGGIISHDTCGFKPNTTSRVTNTTSRVTNTTSRVKRIVGGTESTSREYPHMALIGFANKTAPDWQCRGSLVSERFVLTSAQCIEYIGKPGPPLIVRLGDLNIQSETGEDESMSQTTEYEVEDILLHPDYESPSFYNDIGLIKLKKDVFFTEFIRPICLQTDYRLPKTYALATGWGNTESGDTRGSNTHLLTINISLYNQDVCNMAYKGWTDYFKDGFSEATMLCAGDLEGSKDTCEEDAGGPLQIPLQEPYCMYSQVGITSFGKLCGFQFPSVYTRVSHYIPWIESIVWP